MTNPDSVKTPYQLGKQLESGSTGEVYEAAHPSLPGRFIIKVLRPQLAQVPQALEVFRAELAIVSALRHPHIVQVVEVGTLPQDGRHYLVMERLEGRSLEARLGAGGPLPLDEVVAVIKGVAGALQAAHGRGVVHCELHPGNVFLALAEGHEHGFPKILNFGLARLRNASGGDAGVGAEESRYMAPEQAQGRAELIDGRTDQFALAAMTYRMLSGADAFRGADPIAVLYQVVHEPPAPMGTLAAVDPRVEAVVLRGLSKQQTERYDNVLEFARALEEATTATQDRLVRTRLGHEDTLGEAVLVGKGRELMRTPTGGHRRDTQELDGRRARPPSFTPHGSNMALSDSGVLADEPAWHTEAVDDDDDGLDRVPHHRWRLALFLIGFVVICAGAALWAGWQPPLAWRQSQVWHTLHLPRAADPTLEEPAQRSLPVYATPLPAAPATAIAEPLAPAPSAPAPTGATAIPAAEPPAPAAAALAAPLAAPAAAPQPRRPRRARASRESGSHAGRNRHLDGVVWSEREQRLVPVGAAHAPEAAPVPAPSAAPAPSFPASSAPAPTAPASDGTLPLTPTP